MGEKTLLCDYRGVGPARLAPGGAPLASSFVNKTVTIQTVGRPNELCKQTTPRPAALRMELAAAGEDMKKLREIARVHIARCEGGDMQAIKELADRLDGRPAQILEHSGPDSEPITEIVREIVHMPPPDEIKSIEDMPQQPLDITFVRSKEMEAAD